jgi:2-polyprenyl-6-hydroxyphenyl methylase/3-demethylubiquinone-9 3-methyltransferase
MAKTARHATGTVDPDEVARFARLAEEWWNPEGKFRPLHKFNPVRLGFLRERCLAHFGRDPAALKPFAGLRLVDIGSGGGLVAEPMARLGFAVVGIDAAAENIATARHHAASVGLSIDYRPMAAEALAATGEGFDVVLALEIVEHVADLGAFCGAAATLLRPGGIMILATLNRTMKAWFLAIVGAEYVLRWLPRGTHDWQKFVRPSELAGGLRRAGLHLAEMEGVSYDPLADSWSLGRDLDVNYMMVATKPA